jgi:hypothetical protein
MKIADLHSKTTQRAEWNYEIVLEDNRNDQHYALIYTTPLFYILAPTCFGSSLPSSGNFLDPSDVLAIKIDLTDMIYHPFDLYFK